MVGTHFLKVPVRQGEFFLKRQSQAHRRYLQAIGALATVQRLLPKATTQQDRAAIALLNRPTSEDGPAGDPRDDLETDEPQSDVCSSTEAPILPFLRHENGGQDVCANNAAPVQTDFEHPRLP
jgi:hypothetical protein